MRLTIARLQIMREALDQMPSPERPRKMREWHQARAWVERKLRERGQA